MNNKFLLYFSRIPFWIYLAIKDIFNIIANRYYVAKLKNNKGRNIFFSDVINNEFSGIDCIEIGDNTTFGKGLSLTAWKKHNRETFSPSITIGSNCSFGEYNHISSINSISIGDNFLSGRWVTIIDNSHGYSDYNNLQIAPNERELTSKGPVIIGNNVWLGEKATILPGVRIGNGVIIGANSVVTSDIPDYSIACGIPAKVLRNLNK